MASTPSLQSIVNTIHADAILTAYTPPGSSTPVAVPGGIGESSRAAKQTAPYIAWVPTRDRFELVPPQNNAAGKYSPRLIRTRWMGVNLHLNCAPGAGPADFDQVDVFVNAVIAAIHRNARGSYNLTGGELKDTKGTELTKSWKVYVLGVEFAVPITEMPVSATLVQVTSVTDPLSMKFPNGHEVPSGGPAFPPP